jgi:glycosyltransferase involved in cell wall biosynthesis
MDLSIGMIMKNEEKYLRDCLNGIKPILEQVHSELIIYDTGSTDASVEIAREFTDKVYQIEWRGDFAWARNHTVDRAIGKWYMFLDADEVFTDVEDIIGFFNSGEFRKYKSATYRLKNIQSDTHFSYFNPRRMFKKERDTKFEGKIHEYIPAKLPCKNLQSIANHYGYYFTGPNAREQRKKKNDRNLASLNELYEENPKDRRTLYHLVNEYNNMDNEKSLRYINEGIDLVDGNQRDIYYHVFTSLFVTHHSQLKDWDVVVDTAIKYFNNLEVEHLNIIQLRVQQGQALAALKRHKEAAEAFEQAYIYFKKNKEGKIDDTISGILPANANILDNETPHVSSVVTNFALAGDLDASFDRYERFKEESGTDPKLDILNKYVSTIVKEEKWDGFINLFAFGLKRGQQSDLYSQVIDEIEKALTNAQIKRDVASAILSEDSLMDSDVDYIWLQKLRMGHSEALDYFLEADKPFNRHYGDVLVVAMKHGVDIIRLISNLEVTNTPAFIKGISATNKDFYDVLLTYTRDHLRHAKNSSIKAMRILSDMAHATSVIAGRSNDLAAKLQIDIFESAVRVRHKYLGMVYRGDVYHSEVIGELSNRDQVTFYAGTALLCKDNGDIADGFIKNMDKVITIEPGLKNIVTLLCKEMLAQTAPPPPTLTDEISSLKEIILSLITKGDKLKAAQILRSYAQINPADPDINEIKNRIANMEL